MAATATSFSANGDNDRIELGDGIRTDPASCCGGSASIDAVDRPLPVDRAGD